MSWCSMQFGPKVQLSADNIIQYDASNVVIWSAPVTTSGFTGSYLVLQNDGNVILYDNTGFPRWHSSN